MEKEIYTITDRNALPIFFRNNHDFKDSTGLAPKVCEKITMLFTRPLYALKYIAEHKADNAFCFVIKNQKDLDYIIAVSKGEGVERLGCNVCLGKNEPHERLYPLVNINKIDNFDKFIELFNRSEKCKICFDETKIVQQLGADARAKVLYLTRDITKD